MERNLRKEVTDVLDTMKALGDLTAGLNLDKYEVSIEAEGAAAEDLLPKLAEGVVISSLSVSGEDYFLTIGEEKSTMYLGARGVDVDLVIYRLEDKPVMGERRNSLLPRRVADYERHMSLVRRLSTYEAMKTDLEKSTSDVDKGRALMLDFVIEDLKMLLK